MLKIETKAFEPRKAAIASYKEKISKAHQKLHEGSLDMSGWVDLPCAQRSEEISAIERAAEEIRANYTALVVIGIGGSYLGTRSCYELLEARRSGTKLFFAGWNLSGRYHQQLLHELEHYETAVCVISKSGTTLETTLAFDLFKDYLKRRCGEGYADRIYAVTDGCKGALHREAEENGYHTFALDGAIGGRYSVLTAVGLLPLAVAGLDIKALCNGAGEAYRSYSVPVLADNICYQYAAYRNVLFEEGRAVELFSFPEPEMYGFGDWLRQLFAESEGKNNVGIFPSSLRYSTDLHSVGQFLEEGNPIFFETMIAVTDCADDLTVAGHDKTYNEHMLAVSEAVYRVRNARKTPMVKVTLSALDEENVGALIYFFEKACAVSCLLMGVNPFDQPGVEAYKKEMRNLLELK